MAARVESKDGDPAWLTFKDLAHGPNCLDKVYQPVGIGNPGGFEPAASFRKLTKCPRG